MNNNSHVLFLEGNWLHPWVNMFIPVRLGWQLLQLLTSCFSVLRKRKLSMNKKEWSPLDPGSHGRKAWDSLLSNFFMRGNVFRHLISKYLLNASQVHGAKRALSCNQQKPTLVNGREGEKEFTGRESGSKQNWQETQWTGLGNNLRQRGQSPSQAHTAKTDWLGASGLDTKCWHCHHQPLPVTALMPQLPPSEHTWNCRLLVCDADSRFKVPNRSPRAAELWSHIQAPASRDQGKWVSGIFSIPSGSQGLPPITTHDGDSPTCSPHRATSSCARALHASTHPWLQMSVFPPPPNFCF